LPEALPFAAPIFLAALWPHPIIRFLAYISILPAILTFLFTAIFGIAVSPHFEAVLAGIAGLVGSAWAIYLPMARS